MARKRSKMTRNNPNKRMRREKPKTDLDLISEHDYVIRGDFLFVRPYVFEFKSHFKPRFLNKSVKNVFVEEFKHTTAEYWELEIREGRVMEKGFPIPIDRVWTPELEVVHVVHRHESAVLSHPVHIAHNAKDFMVISKPPSIPIHPCGTYRRNSLQFILRAFHGTEKLHPVHRLDKETSGLVIFAKIPEAAARFSQDIKEHKVRKTYLAEVEGLFPEHPVICNESLYWDKREMKAFVRQDGATAETSFFIFSKNIEKNTSIIECKPLTGRTHQIRVHLAHLGYPILNDPLYGNLESNDRYWTTEEFLTDPTLASLNDIDFIENFDSDAPSGANIACEWSKNAFAQHGRPLSSLEEGRLLSCQNCPQVTNEKNVGFQHMFIHLHALKYESDSWKFEVPLPPWVSNLGKPRRREKSLQPEQSSWNCVLS